MNPHEENMDYILKGNMEYEPPHLARPYRVPCFHSLTVEQESCNLLVWVRFLLEAFVEIVVE